MALGAQDGAAGQVVGRGGRGCLGLGRLHSWPGPHAGPQGPRAWAASVPREHPQQPLCRAPLCGMVWGLGLPGV